MATARKVKEGLGIFLDIGISRFTLQPSSGGKQTQMSDVPGWMIDRPQNRLLSIANG
jgi:hypothetical protein